MISDRGTNGDDGATSVGARLRAVRRQKGLTLQGVEHVTGGEFKASVLGAYERSQRRIAVPRLQRLAEIYRVPVEQLLPPRADGSDDHRHVGEATEDGRAVIDLTNLDRVHGPERDVLRRYLQSIEVQRQDFNGRVITIRRDDIRVIASLFQHSPTGMVTRLHELGLLAARP